MVNILQWGLKTFRKVKKKCHDKPTTLFETLCECRLNEVMTSE